MTRLAAALAEDAVDIGQTFMFRRLPVYLVIDCSYSMRGHPIQMVQEGLTQMVSDLRSDPMALETVCLSIITFATEAKVASNLKEVFSFKAPTLESKGRSDMGAGLRLLLQQLDEEVRPNSVTMKGDWKPIAFLLSDGGPSDAWITQAKELHARHVEGRLTMVAVGFDERAHTDKLLRVTPIVLISTSKEPAAFSRFLKWVSTSISRSVQTSSGSIDLYDSPLPTGFSLNQQR